MGKHRRTCHCSHIAALCRSALSCTHPRALLHSAPLEYTRTCQDTELQWASLKQNTTHRPDDGLVLYRLISYYMFNQSSVETSIFFPHLKTPKMKTYSLFFKLLSESHNTSQQKSSKHWSWRSNWSPTKPRQSPRLYSAGFCPTPPQQGAQ